MKLRIVPRSWIARNIVGMSITLYPFILLTDDLELAKRLRILHHELVHIDQIRRLGVLRFYTTYVWEFVCNFVRFRNWRDAYLGISFEDEAYRLMFEKELPPEFN